MKSLLTRLETAPEIEEKNLLKERLKMKRSKKFP